jgi:hypothetical protein
MFQHLWSTKCFTDRETDFTLSQAWYPVINMLNPLLSSFIMFLPEPVGPRFLNGLLTIKLALCKIHTHFEKLTYLVIHSLYRYETLSACLQDFEDYILVLTPSCASILNLNASFVMVIQKASYATEWKVTLFALVRCLFATCWRCPYFSLRAKSTNLCRPRNFFKQWSNLGDTVPIGKLLFLPVRLRDL